MNNNINDDDIEFLTCAIPTIKDFSKEEIETLTTSIPIIKDYSDEEINELLKKIPSLKKEDIEKLKEALGVKEEITFKKFVGKKYYKVLVVLLVFIVLFSLVGIGFSFSLEQKVDKYEEYFVDIDEKESTTMQIGHDFEINKDYIKDSKASRIVSCIESNVDNNNLPDYVTSVINEINDYYNGSINRFSFKYVDIYTGFTVSYNENQRIATASTIKAPTDIYIYEEAAEGKVDLNEELLYTTNYYNDGAGYIKLGPQNKNYSIKDLVFNSLYYSDNIAHTMLMDRFKRENLYEFWKNKGTNELYKQKTIWGYTTGHDAAIYMKELYDFYQTGNEYAKELMSYFLDNAAKFLSSEEGIKIASKSGCAGSAIHDVAIIFDENPYILVAMSNLGCLTQGDYFDVVSNLANKLHKAYWNYKLSSCLNM